MNEDYIQGKHQSFSFEFIIVQLDKQIAKVGRILNNVAAAFQFQQHKLLNI